MFRKVSRAREPCESRDGRPGPPGSNSPYGLCGRKATLNLNLESRSAGVSYGDVLSEIES